MSDKPYYTNVNFHYPRFAENTETPTSPLFVQNLSLTPPHQKTRELFVERLGDKSTGVMWAYQGLGEAAVGQGDATAAREWLSADLRLSSELGTRIMIAWCLAGLGSVAALNENSERAARLWGAAAQLRSTLGSRPASATRATYEHLLALARAYIGDDAFVSA